MLNQQHNSGTAEFKITFFFAFFYLAGFRMQVGDLSYIIAPTSISTSVPNCPVFNRQYSRVFSW